MSECADHYEKMSSLLRIAAQEASVVHAIPITGNEEFPERMILTLKKKKRGIGVPLDWTPTDWSNLENLLEPLKYDSSAIYLKMAERDNENKFRK